MEIANYLCNGNYAVSGDMKAIDCVSEIAKPEFKARMAIKLAVAGAFHTKFMAPAGVEATEAEARSSKAKSRSSTRVEVAVKPRKLLHDARRGVAVKPGRLRRRPWTRSRPRSPRRT